MSTVNFFRTFVFSLAVFTGIIGLSVTSDAVLLVDFEDAVSYGGDNAQISNQYVGSHGVSFSLMAGATKGTAIAGLPTYELIGDSDPVRGFLYDQGSAYDVEAPAHSGKLGRFFMKAVGDVSTNGYVKLIIDYAFAVNAASGQIWDIDGHSNGTERWEVKAYDSGGTELHSLLSPDGVGHGPGSLDGSPWGWAIAVDNIWKIEIEFIGTKTSGVGLAFDNFSPSEIPEPGMMSLIGLGVLVLFFRKKRTLG